MLNRTHNLEASDESRTCRRDLAEETRKNYQEEYKEVSSNLIHYSNLRFAVFTVLLAIEVGLMGASFGWIAQAPSGVSILSRVGGIIATFVFWIFHERIIAYRRVFLQRATHLETELGYNLYLSRPKPMLGFLGTSFASRFLFLALALFWIGAFFFR